MKTQMEKGQTFRALHAREGAFLIPNPWDAGTARLLERLGFEALATTSAGYAFSVGRQDNTVDRDAMMDALDCNGGRQRPAGQRRLGERFWRDSGNRCGNHPACGGRRSGRRVHRRCHGREDHPIYERKLAAERIKAAVEAARSMPFPFTLTARAENYLNGKPDLKDTINRLQLYQEAGADVLYAPGLVNRDDIAAVVSAVDRPVNVLLGLQGVALSVKDLAAIGVRRVSVGSALCRAALGAFLRAAREMRERGTFSFAEEAVSFREISGLFEA